MKRPLVCVCVCVFPEPENTIHIESVWWVCFVHAWGFVLSASCDLVTYPILDAVCREAPSSDTCPRPFPIGVSFESSWWHDASRQCESQPPSHQDKSDTWLRPSASPQSELQASIHQKCVGHLAPATVLQMSARVETSICTWKLSDIWLRLLCVQVRWHQELFPAGVETRNTRVSTMLRR